MSYPLSSWIFHAALCIDMSLNFPHEASDVFPHTFLFILITFRMDSLPIPPRRLSMTASASTAAVLRCRRPYFLRQVPICVSHGMSQGDEADSKHEWPTWVSKRWTVDASINGTNCKLQKWFDFLLSLLYSRRSVKCHCLLGCVKTVEAENVAPEGPSGPTARFLYHKKSGSKSNEFCWNAATVGRV